ncbi:hypothetical protein MMC07_006079 [Pseudocyphellaria aurata]|nr:hypothetical protein [Pseudocyphellaria aurata]
MQIKAERRNATRKQHILLQLGGTAVDQGVLWGGLAIAIICCGLRFLARIRIFKKLLIDDYFVVFALIFAITNAIIWQIFIRKMYHTINMLTGLETLDVPFIESYFRFTVAVYFLFYSSLWSIKISFLLFFRRLGTHVTNHKLLWWPVFALTVAAYFVHYGTVDYKCLFRPIENLTACTAPSKIPRQQALLKVDCALDVLTDFLSKSIELSRDVVNSSTVMLIPITMLWGLQMKWRRKFALAGIFSLVVITMTFAVIRIAVITSSETYYVIDSSWLYMWSAIEVYVGQWTRYPSFIDIINNTVPLAIIVACLASFRNLFSRGNPQHRPERFEPPAASNLFPRGSKPRSRMRHFIDTLASTSESSYSSYQVQVDSGNGTESMTDHRHDSHDQIPSEKVVHVRKDVVLVHEVAQV